MTRIAHSYSKNKSRKNINARIQLDYDDILISCFALEHRYMYSNSNFIILGAILEMISGKSWEELMRTELFQRNNMKRCGFGNPARVERDGLTGHVRKASKENIKIKMGPGDDNPSSLGPAGTVHAPLESWFKFVMSCLPNSNYVSSQTLKDLHRPIRSKSTYAGGWVRRLVFLFQQIILLTNHNNRHSAIVHGLTVLL